MIPVFEKRYRFFKIWYLFLKRIPILWYVIPIFCIVIPVLRNVIPVFRNVIPFFLNVILDFLKCDTAFFVPKKGEIENSKSMCGLRNVSGYRIKKCPFKTRNLLTKPSHFIFSLDSDCKTVNAIVNALSGNEGSFESLNRPLTPR